MSSETTFHTPLPPFAQEARFRLARLAPAMPIVHVFGPGGGRFPFAPERTYTPVDAPKETLFALQPLSGHRTVDSRSGQLATAPTIPRCWT